MPARVVYVNIWVSRGYVFCPERLYVLSREATSFGLRGHEFFPEKPGVLLCEVVLSRALLIYTPANRKASRAMVLAASGKANWAMFSLREARRASSAKVSKDRANSSCSASASFT